LLPGVDRIGGLVDPAFSATRPGLEAATQAASTKRIHIERVDLRMPTEVEAAFLTLRRGQVGAVLVFGGSMLFARRREIADLSVKARLPTMFPYREAVEAGGLMSYGPNLRDLWQRSAGYVDRLLRGARAADLPIEQPVRFELAINLKTARTLGLTIPPSLLLRADQVIE